MNKKALFFVVPFLVLFILLSGCTEPPPPEPEKYFCETKDDCEARCAFGCVNKEWKSEKPDCFLEPDYRCDCVNNKCVKEECKEVTTGTGCGDVREWTEEDCLYTPPQKAYHSGEYDNYDCALESSELSYCEGLGNKRKCYFYCCPKEEVRALCESTGGTYSGCDPCYESKCERCEPCSCPEGVKFDFRKGCLLKECDKLEEQIREEIEKLNYCEEDEDCKTEMFGCPFGSYSFVNKGSDQKRVGELIEEYDSKCIRCEYELLPPPTSLECKENKCVEKKEVTISTDRLLYNEGEKVNITVFNGLEEGIYFIPGLRSISSITFWKRVEGNWEIVYANQLEPMIPTKEYYKELLPNHFQEEEWDQKITDENNQRIFAGEGTYKLKLSYVLASDFKGSFWTNKSNTVESKEFKIKESDVVIEMEKDEFGEGENIKFEVLFDKNIYYNYLYSWGIMKFDESEWIPVQTYCDCIVSCEDECGSIIVCEAEAIFIGCIEADPTKTEVNYHWNQKECEIKDLNCFSTDQNKEIQWNCIERKQVRKGKYKVIFKYLDECVEGNDFLQQEGLIEVEREFTIK